MLSIEFQENIQKRLLNLSNLTGQSVEHIVTQHIIDNLEDLEDMHISLDRVMNSKREFLTSKEVIETLEKKDV